MILLVTIIFGALYLFLIDFLIRGWNSIKPYEPENENNLPDDIFISVVVAARNEENNINELLNSLKQQSLPEKHFEIIIIDDHSTDSTNQLIEGYANEISNLRLFNLTENIKGKKAALGFAIENAKGELIVTTDADCTMGNEWLKTIAKYYVDKQPEMIISPVIIKGQSVFAKLQSLEFMSLIASTAGACGLKHPIMCNGANLAFRKKTYESLKTNLKNYFASGDDIFLMLAIKEKDPYSIRFLKSKQAVVYTNAQKDLKSFFSQRFRWTSKSRAYHDKDIVLTALLIYFVNAWLVLLLISSLIEPFLFGLFLMSIVLKTIPDFILLKKASHFFDKGKLMRWFIPLQFIYIFYITFTGFFGNFMNIKWNGRRIFSKN